MNAIDARIPTMTGGEVGAIEKPHKRCLLNEVYNSLQDSTRMRTKATFRPLTDDDRPPVSSIVKPSQDGTAEPLDSCPIN